MSDEKRQLAKDFAEATIPLLGDYTRNLQQVAKESIELHNQISKLREQVNGRSENGATDYVNRIAQANVNRLQRLRPAADRLAQAASQWIQHADLDDAMRLALEARLGELEAMRDYAAAVVDAVFWETVS